MFFTDIEGAKERIKGINEIEILSKVKTGKGLKWKETRTMFGKSATEVMWITEYKQNQFYKVAAESHGTKYLSTYSFKELDSKTTEVTMTFSGTPVSLSSKVMSLFSFAFKGSITKMLHADMEDLMKACES